MKKLFMLLTVAVAVVGITSCGGKSDSNRIIAPKPVKQKPKATQKVGDYSQTRDVEWLGSHYKIEVKRVADTSLPLADDGSGNKYFDNRITVRILRSNGTEFFCRTFTKADFDASLEATYRKNGALLGIVYDQVVGKRLIFAASVGSPDKMSDEYMPLLLKISNLGSVEISKDNQLDTGGEGSAKKSEIDLAEEEGM
ncbi:MULTISPECIES: DUF4738 domain-containing protein [Prevotellaceae]|uniref:DUF4738 domain-containing protein n=1 Tax=Prevotellaceae TaxID=171552 RepID=UPI0003D39F67|nr:DUF4738 domain-containing protein [Prevotella phocaeensis]ETD15812.1 hypothetical protein HMPREF1199_02507 [Hoylesella oralis CC98A]